MCEIGPTVASRRCTIASAPNTAHLYLKISLKLAMPFYLVKGNTSMTKQLPKTQNATRNTSRSSESVNTCHRKQAHASNTTCPLPPTNPCHQMAGWKLVTHTGV